MDLKLIRQQLRPQALISTDAGQFKNQAFILRRNSAGWIVSSLKCFVILSGQLLEY